jgi:hypothetical protein
MAYDRLDYTKYARSMPEIRTDSRYIFATLHLARNGQFLLITVTGDEPQPLTQPT